MNTFTIFNTQQSTH